MTADRLRTAAALMRERAEAARAGRWIADDGVALAVADLLEKAAVISTWGKHIGCGPVADVVDEALAVADAYLLADAKADAR